jgi:hypothetical protein
MNGPFTPGQIVTRQMCDILNEMWTQLAILRNIHTPSVGSSLQVQRDETGVLLWIDPDPADPQSTSKPQFVTPTNTTSTASISSGTGVVITPTSMAGVIVGANLILSAGNASEVVTVTSVNTAAGTFTVAAVVNSYTGPVSITGTITNNYYPGYYGVYVGGVFQFVANVWIAPSNGILLFPGVWYEGKPGLPTLGIPSFVTQQTANPPTVAPVTIATNTNNLPTPTTDVIQVDVTAVSILTGIVALGSNVPQTLTIVNAGTAILILVNHSGSSSAANQFTTTGGYPVPIFPGQTATLLYDPVTMKWLVFPVPVPTALITTTSANTAISTNQNNYNLPTGVYVQMEPTTDNNITGIVPTNSGVSEIKFLVNTSSTYTFTLVNQSGSSSSANQITTSTGTDLAVGPGQLALLVYNPTIPGWDAFMVTGGGSSLTVEQTSGGTPVTAVTTLEFDATDFAVTGSGGTASVSFVGSVGGTITSGANDVLRGDGSGDAIGDSGLTYGGSGGLFTWTGSTSGYTFTLGDTGLVATLTDGVNTMYLCGNGTGAPFGFYLGWTNGAGGQVVMNSAGQNCAMYITDNTNLVRFGTGTYAVEVNKINCINGYYANTTPGLASQTVVLAALTLTGSQGSLTISLGIVTGYTAPT